MITHTYVTLDLSPAAYGEIRKKLEAAGYGHTFHEDGLIDMHGIAVYPSKHEPVKEYKSTPAPPPRKY